MLDVDRLYREHHRAILRYLLKRTADLPLAEDLAQATFLRAFERAATYEDRGLPVTAWLYQIARNIHIDHCRLAARRPPPISAELLLEWGRDIAAPDPAIEAVERDLTPLLATLSARQRQVIELRFLQGYPTKDTAAAVGTTVEAVKKLQARALVNLGRAIIRKAA